MYFHVGTTADLEKIVHYDEQALKLDPNFVSAWVHLSAVLCDLAVHEGPQGLQAWEKARRAAKQALALDPKRSGAHLAVAKIFIFHDWDWVGAQEQIQQALELDPGSEAALRVAGWHARALGQFDKSLEHLQKGIAIDPLNPRAYFILGRVLYGAGRLDDAQVALRKSLDLNPREGGAHSLAGQVMLARGDPVAALAEFERENDEDDRQFGRALAFYALGRKAEADAALVEVEQKYTGQSAYRLAQIRAYRGEIDQAFSWLDRAYRQRDSGCTWVKGDPMLRNLEADPRWKAFLRKMKLPE
jgi:tetratricopeptide (TPR) repeat protein